MSEERSCTARLWDVAVVGTGMGGATVGYALAQQGFSVLFLEKGGAIAASDEFVEPVTPEERLAAGWWPHPVSQRRSSGVSERFTAPIGCAHGGSTIHYAAALERMAPSDFQGLQAQRQQIPPWPATYDEFLPCYEAAETLYGLNGTASHDERLSEWDRALMDAMRRNGLKPDQLRVGMRYDKECQECVGRVCPRACKKDARSACLDEALRHPRCEILDHCDVQTLEADHRQVRTVKALRFGEAIEVRARVVVLAAGALHSPQILLRSVNEHWPNGLANRSDQVGRNLMFHTTDNYALFAPRRLSRSGRQKKSISVRDFYFHKGQRLGYVQSLGMDAGRGYIAAYLKDILRRRGLRNEFLLSLLVKLPSHLVAWLLGEASLFAAMTEDDPDPENRILLDDAEPNGAVFVYAMTDDLRKRAGLLREEFTRHVRPWRVVRLSPTLRMNHGHPCGTCRFGVNPDTSVLDRDNRAHDVHNLFVVDASFMPRSGAVNPSLTIAANALRVAPKIADQLSA